jgi:hypothetical protein
MSAASGFDEPGWNQNQTPAASKMITVVANVYLNIEGDLPGNGVVFSKVLKKPGLNGGRPGHL